jgi:RNA polymerase sigma-32 factor
MVSREQEHELALRWRRDGDISARDSLLRSQLRYVVAIARKYRRYGCASLDELVAEGNFGLVKALDKFDPERGTRLVTYASYWIRAYISQYLMRSRSIVSSGVRSKVLSKIRRKRNEILQTRGDVANLNEQVAEHLALSPDKLHGLLERMDVHDLSWDPTVEDTPGGSPAAAGEPVSARADERLISAERGNLLSVVLSVLVSQLDDRERYIVQGRLMAHRDDELTLAEIGRYFGFSRERARQLEARAMKKVKLGLARSQLASEYLSRRDAA